MMVYNETVIVEEIIHNDWLYWMQNEYIPLMMATGCFNNHTILKVVDSPNEGVTYCVQYLTDSIQTYQQFANVYQPDLFAIHQQQFANQFVIFTTLMQTIN